MSISRSLTAALVALLVAASCGSSEDPGDPEAFCDLLRDGVGLTAGGVDGLDSLELTAPPEIRSTVRQLANTARSLDEIPDQDLDELFSAAFDPEAIEARNELRRHAVDECGSAPADSEAPSGSGPEDEATAQAEVIDYITTNFGTTMWVSQISVEAEFAFGRLESVRAQFDEPPATPDDALAACNALAVYLYEIRGASGEVTVKQGDTLLAGRSGPTTQCVRP